MCTLKFWRIYIVLKFKIFISANAKGSSDLNVWVWDEEKALNYLNSKIEKLTNEIISKRLTLLGMIAYFVI